MVVGGIWFLDYIYYLSPNVPKTAVVR